VKNEIEVLKQVVKEAGAEILKLQKTGFTISIKANKDIVTKADLLANEIIKRGLMSAFPGYGWLSEECVDDATRLTQQKIWIVDPIDGTKEFTHGMPEYAISVALVERGAPICAVVFNPAANQFFHAIKGQGAWLNDKQIHCRGASALPMVLLASRSEFARGEWDKYQTMCQVIQMGSIAYKLALVAAGQAEGTFSLGPKSEWDIAAGALLVTEAGGCVTTKKKESIYFNRHNVLVDSIVASSKDSNEQIFSLITA
jgi:myo-inositol-1(or 4)-monophosphatase